jgi:hypothetical protein
MPFIFKVLSVIITRQLPHTQISATPPISDPTKHYAQFLRLPARSPAASGFQTKHFVPICECDQSETQGYMIFPRDVGISRPRDFAVSIHSAITISACSRAADRVFPSAMQPGNSETSAM